LPHHGGFSPVDEAYGAVGWNVSRCGAHEETRRETRLASKEQYADLAVKVHGKSRKEGSDLV